MSVHLHREDTAKVAGPTAPQDFTRRIASVAAGGPWRCCPARGHRLGARVDAQHRQRVATAVSSSRITCSWSSLIATPASERCTIVLASPSMLSSTSPLPRRCTVGNRVRATSTLPSSFGGSHIRDAHLVSEQKNPATAPRIGDSAGYGPHRARRRGGEPMVVSRRAFLSLVAGSMSASRVAFAQPAHKAALYANVGAD